MSKITSAILIIGNEILSGRTQDINIKYIAKELVNVGILLEEVRVVPDKKNSIIVNLNDLRKNYDYVFTTGGIGPTHDDITSESISYALNKEYKINDEAYEILKNYYPENEFNENRIKMTKMPEGAKLIHNPLTMAPGFYVENIFVLPGVPRILQSMFDSVKKLLKLSDPILSKTINVNLYESIIANSLSKIQLKYSDCEIGSYPKFDNIKKFGGVNIVVSGKNQVSIDNAIKEIILSVKNLGGVCKDN